MRWLPLVLAGCIFLDEEQLLERLDVDGDGLPVTSDCNDRQATTGELVAMEAPLICGDQRLGVLPDLNLVRLELRPLEFTPCAHPLASGQLLQVGTQQQIYELRVPAATDVVVTLSAEDFTAFAVEPNLPVAVLFANRGAVCTADSCAPGFPLVEPDDDLGRSGAIDASVTFAAVPGEVWYVVVAGAEGAFNLSVDCLGSPDAGGL